MKRLQNLSEQALEHLEQRGIDGELAVRLGLVSATHPADKRDWIAFRHHVDGGERDHWSYRTLSGAKDFRQSSGTARRLWNNECIADRTLDHEVLIITEGHLDALSLMTAGYRRVVSVPDGAPNEPSAADGAKTKYAYLDGAGLEHVQQIILATDADNPGAALLHDLAIRLGRSKCKWVRYPDGCKDANDVLRQHGIEELVRCISGARWVKLSGLYTLDEIPPEPAETVSTIGIQGLDELWKLSRGRMSVVTGIPGHGKSALLTDVACRMAEQGWVVVIASFEDTLRGSLIPRLQRWYLRNDPAFATAPNLARANKWIAEWFVFIQPEEGDEENPNVTWFIERAEAAVLRHNATLVILDPWNELDHTARPEDVSQTEYVGVMLSRMRRHAKTYRYHLVVAAHPAKLQTNSDGKYPIPTGYSISDSANWVNKPDSGITVYRFADDFSQIGCWKCRREGFIGRRGKMRFKFAPDNQRYLAAPERDG